MNPQYRVKAQTRPSVTWPLQDIVLLLVVCARVDRPFILPARLHCPCTAFGQYTTPPPTPLVYAIHHKILVIAISCKGQGAMHCKTTSLVTCWPIQDIRSLVFVCARINHPFINSAHSRYPHYCITIARLLRHIHPPSTLPLYATHHRILVMTISCKGLVTWQVNSFGQVSSTRLVTR